MERYPTTKIRDLFPLVGNISIELITRRRKRDIGLVLTRWLRGLIDRYNSKNITLNLLVRRVLLVTDPKLSAHILRGKPSSHGYMAGTLKVDGMSFLAPNALTISHDEQWQGLRSFNEQVLYTDQPHIHQQAYLGQVRGAFADSNNITSMDDIRQRMGKAMLGIVFGETTSGEIAAPESLIDEIQFLFGEVSLRTALFGSKQTERRDRFHAQLHQLWQARNDSSASALLSVAQHTVDRYDFSEEIFVEQIPHWMFTFTGSGSDLLARTLAIIMARPQVQDKIYQEMAAAGPVDQASTIDSLDYLEACLLETCRLYPPVIQTAHRSPNGDTFDGIAIEPGTEILHFFPLTQRDIATDPTANTFQPERWLDPAQNAAAAYPNLFLSGMRSCPGRSLILFVCKSALALLLTKQSIPVQSDLLAVDPLPFSFPEWEVSYG